MEFRGDVQRWDPMMDAFNDEAFNSYRHTAALHGVSSSDSVVIFVAGIPPSLTEAGLKNLMANVADIQRIALIPHKNIAFVSVRKKDADKVIAYYNNYKMGDNYLTVKLSKENKQTETPPSGTATRIATVSESELGQKETTGHLSSPKYVDELNIPALMNPSAAKYVQVGEKFAVKVLNIISPSQFWICRHPFDDDQLKELQAKMQTHYSSLPKKTGFKRNRSPLYAAHIRDSGNWCRVQELSCDTESVSVLLLDYGTCERVGLTDLHSLEGHFLSLPFQAMCCSLAHVQGTPRWSVRAADCMRQLLSKDKVCAKVCAIDGYFLIVELILSSSSQTVNDILVMKKFASYVKGFVPSSIQAGTTATVVSDSASRLYMAESSDDNVTVYHTVRDLSHVQLTVGEQYEVIVLHARNVSDVTVCLSSNVGKLQTLLTEMHTYQLSDCYVPHVGEVIAARYAADGSCYRAKVLSIDNSNTASVLFLDFGNTATVDLKSVGQLQPQHIACPVFGINIGFRSVNVDSDLLVEYHSLNLKVLEERSNQYVVSLVDDEEVNVAKSPSSQHTYSISDIEQCCLDTGETYKAVVTDATDVENFFVQVTQYDYQAIDDQLETLYSSKSRGYVPQQTGELIVVHLNEDDTLCRAVVTEIENKEAVKCQLIDFGMTVTTTSKDISRFDCQLLTHPVAAFKCSFYDAVVSSVDTWNEDCLRPMMNVFNMTVVEVKDHHHFVELVDVESGVVWKQKLIDDGFLVKARSSDLQTVVSSTAVDKLPSDSAGHFVGNKPGDSAHDSTTASVSGNRQTDTKSGSHMVNSEEVLPSLCDDAVEQLYHNRERIVVVHANSPSDFYIQSRSVCTQKELESLQKSVNNFCRQSSCKLSIVSIGQIIGVLHDGVWYRGEVVSSDSHDKFQVHFVDFGFTKTAISADLRSLPDALALALPRQAIHCAIDRIVGCEPAGSWSVDAIKWFQKFCANHDLTLKLIYKNNSGSSWMVDFLDAASRRTAKDMLLAHKFAVRGMNSSLKNSKSASQCSQVLPDTGRKETRGKTSPLLLSSAVENASIQEGENVTVTCINSPCSFFIQQQHQSTAEVLQELNSYCKEHGQVHRPKQVGELVAVMRDSLWNRAEVLSLDADSASVFFIDYGNTIDNVDVKDIRALPLRFATVLPKLAVRCAIGGITGTCTDGRYSEAACRWFEDSYFQMSSIVVKVKHTDPSGALLINLMNKLTSAKTARRSLLDYGMALTSTLATADSSATTLTQSSQMHVPPLSDVVPCTIRQPYVEPTLAKSREHARVEDAPLLQEHDDVHVVHIVSPADFYVMHSAQSSLGEFILLSQKLLQYCSTSGDASYHPHRVGELVAAKFEGEWFRAEVVELMSNTRSKVFFVDYGNTAVVVADDLRRLHEEFVKCPKQAVHCGIAGVCGAGSGQAFTEAATKWFKLFCSGSCATLTSVRVAGRKHLVDISVDGNGAKEHLIALGFAREV